MKAHLKAVLRIFLFPVLRYFGPRFANIHLRLDTIDRRLDQVDRSFESLEKRLVQFEDRAFTDIESTIEIFTLQQRIAAGLEQKAASLERLLASGPSDQPNL
ncbi:MAG: hypothetical protein ACR2FO_02170 [Actinomycetota bacterium]